MSFIVSKPALADPDMPTWVRWLQPLLSGVFTVDNLDYVRRDAWMTGVAVDVDVERLRRYAFIGERGTDAVRAGPRALEMFLTSRLFLYQQVYFHRTVRAIDLDLAEVFGPSIRAIFGDRSPADALGAYADLDEYGLLHQAARWTRGEDLSAAPTRATAPSRPTSPTTWRAVLLRRPGWRSEAERRFEYEAGARPRRRDRRPGHRRAGPGRDRPGRRSMPGRPTRPRRTRCWRSRPATARRCRSARPSAVSPRMP